MRSGGDGIRAIASVGGAGGDGNSDPLPPPPVLLPGQSPRPVGVPGCVPGCISGAPDDRRGCSGGCCGGGCPPEDSGDVTRRWLLPVAPAAAAAPMLCGVGDSVDRGLLNKAVAGAGAGGDAAAAGGEPTLWTYAATAGAGAVGFGLGLGLASVRPGLLVVSTLCLEGVGLLCAVCVCGGMGTLCCCAALKSPADSGRGARSGTVRRGGSYSQTHGHTDTHTDTFCCLPAW